MSQDIAKQTEVEYGLVKLLMDGLRSTLAWKVQGNDFSRKLSTVRFIVRSFQGHLDRLFALEEYDGYMDLVNKRAPRLDRTVDALKQEHNEFRTGIRRISLGLERISSTDQARFSAACDELLDLLDKLEAHGRKETDVIQEAFEQDRGGGEG
jgi:hemerythrin-like domain-containing protein